MIIFRSKWIMDALASFKEYGKLCKIGRYILAPAPLPETRFWTKYASPEKSKEKSMPAKLLSKSETARLARNIVPTTPSSTNAQLPYQGWLTIRPMIAIVHHLPDMPLNSIRRFSKRKLDSVDLRDCIDASTCRPGQERVHGRFKVFVKK